MSQLQFAFWDKEPNLLPDFRESLKVFYWRVPIVSEDARPMLWDESIDRLLQTAADRTDIQWLCVMAVGTLFPDQIRITKLIQKTIQSLPPDFLVAGHLINKAPKYCGLHEQTFIVNMETYRRLGRPAFGNYERKILKLRNYHAGESIHDDYTPKTLTPAEGHREYETWTCGWNMVNASMEAGLPIHNLPEDLRTEKIYAYPDDNLEKLNRNLRLLFELDDMDNVGQRKMLGYLFNKRFGFNPITKGSGVNLSPRDGAVFLFNTEFLLPDPEWIARNRQPLDMYIGPCAGFLEMASLFAHGFHSNTKVIYFDINHDSIAAKRRVLNEFDGDLDRLPAYFRQIIETSGKPYLYFIANPEKEIARLLELFGSKENFKKNWQALQQLPKEFHWVNLISSGKSLLEKLPSGKRSVFAISDIFTGQNELTYGASGIQRRYDEFINACRAYPELIISGKDLKGIPMINFAKNIR